MIEEAAYTTTSVFVCITLTLFTLSALYQGMQNIPLSSTKQSSLKSQAFVCMVIPIVIVYYAKIALTSYMSSFFASEDDRLAYEDYDFDELNNS